MDENSRRIAGSSTDADASGCNRSRSRSSDPVVDLYGVTSLSLGQVVSAVALLAVRSVKWSAS